MNQVESPAETTVAKCGAPTSQAAITIDGEAATLTTYAGAQACFGLSQQWATVIHGGWAWNIVRFNKFDDMDLTSGPSIRPTRGG